MIKAKTPTAPAKKKGASASAGLPPGFSHLEHWIAAWVLPNAQARTDKRQTTPYPEIKNFYDEMLAAAPSALDYLRQCTLGKLDALDNAVPRAHKGWGFFAGMCPGLRLCGVSPRRNPATRHVASVITPRCSRNAARPKTRSLRAHPHRDRTLIRLNDLRSTRVKRRANTQRAKPQNTEDLCHR